MAAAALDLKTVAHVAAHPSHYLEDIRRIRSERSLLNFATYMWPVLEPGREFKRGWALSAMAEHLEAVTAGQIRKLLINVPPGCMKSLMTNVLWPAWEWGPKDMSNMRYVCASYAERLSIRDNRKCRNLLVSQEYRSLWDIQLTDDQNAKQKFENTKTGFKLATSVGGVGTGERGDRLIIDDPHNVLEGESEAKREEALQWFSETMSTRVNDPDTAAYVVIMQRVHERDVSGLILAQELGYEHLMLPMEFEPERRCWITIKPKYNPAATQEQVFFNPSEKSWQTADALPPEMNMQEMKTEARWNGDPRHELGEMLWEERFSRDYVENDLKPSLRSWGGTYAEAGQLQQRPTPRGGGMFQRADFQFIEPHEVASLRGHTVRGWDLAASEGLGSAYTAGVKGMIDQHKRLVILDVVRFKKLPGAVKTMLGTIAKQDGHPVHIDLPQDPGQAGKAQKADLAKELHGYNVSFGLESGDKVVRATPVSAQAEAQNLYLVRAPWNDAFIAELCVFPKGQFKDQADATSRMYSNLVRTKPALVGMGGKLYEG